METNSNGTGRSIMAVFSGVLSTIATGAILWPLVYLVFDAFFELHFGDPPPGQWKNDLIINATLILWLFIACFTGGFVCARIAQKKEFLHAGVLVGIGIIVLFSLLAREGMNRHDILPVSATTISSSVGFLAGCRLAIRYKRKKAAASF